jgi:hypothetical protein
MDVCFIYQAAILCKHCGASVRDELQENGKPDTEDSDTFPQESIIGESDTPDHCDICGEFFGESIDAGRSRICPGSAGARNRQG